MPPTYMLIAMVAMIIVNFLFPVAIIIPSPWNLLGIIPLALGVIINVIADRIFHETNTTVKPFEQSSALITGGVYRISRNPMYLGFVLILIGIAILMRSLAPYGVIPVFLVVMEIIFIRTEEQMLAAKFGTDWIEYKKTTRRWL